MEALARGALVAQGALGVVGAVPAPYEHSRSPMASAAQLHCAVGATSRLPVLPSRPCSGAAAPRRGQATWRLAPALAAPSGAPQGSTQEQEQGQEQGAPGAQAQAERVALGGSRLRVPRLGVGTLQWGDAAQGYGGTFSEGDLREAFCALAAAGLDLFDTAEVYGYQGIKSGASSEQLLGKFERELLGEGDAAAAPVIATKFFTIPWTNLLVGGGFRLGKQSLLEALRASLGRLGRAQVDLYQIHFPFPTFSNAALMEALSQAVDEGLTAAVGVSNYSARQMEEAHSLLAQRGIPLASNQVRYSLVARGPEKNGLLQMCKDLNVSLVAYSPLASGLLSERSLGDPSTSEARKALPLLEALQSVGQAQGGKTVSQVALAYLMHKGAIPIPACKNVKQAQSHIDTLAIALSDADVLAIEERASALGF